MKNRKNNFQSFIQIGLGIILIFSVIQIFPIDLSIIKKVTASSTWADTNWLAPSNYTDLWQVDIIIDSGDLKLHCGHGIFVADCIHHQIVKTNMNGSIWTALGSQGSGKGQFNCTEAVSYDDSTGFIYVTDYYNCRIVKTKIDGTGWTTYGSYGLVPGKGKFRFPMGITLFDSCYCSKGFLSSRNYDCSRPSNFQTISWVAETPINTSIKFQLRTANNESNLAIKDFIGPDGTNSTYYITSGATIWSGHNGDQWIQYKVYLSTNNLSKTPILKDVTTIFNLLPNRPILIAPENNTCTNDNTTTFTWSFNDIDSSSQSGYQWQIDDIIEFNDIDYDSKEIISSKSSYTQPSPIADGIWYWRVKTKDSDNGWGPFSLPWKILIDTIAPSSEIIYPSNNKFYNDIDSISGLTSDSANGSGLDKVEITIHRITDDSYWDGTSWVDSESWLLVFGTTEWNYNSSSISWSSGIEYRIRSRATDNASNIEIPGIGNKFIYDVEHVIYSNAYPLADEVLNTTQVEVGITISDMISGVNASTIEYSISTDKGNTWSSWFEISGLENNQNIDVKINLTFPNGTENRIRWRAYDLAGNGPKESMAYIVNVNTWQQILHPRVRLWSPPNASIIQTTSAELSWMLENTTLWNVNYDVYIDTVNPPEIINQSIMINTSLIVNDLIDGETYYWTVIPRIGTYKGMCGSGIWSFIVDIPLPQVKLTSPENGSIVPSIKPTLSWSVKYEGSEILSYDVYLDTNDPPVEYEKCPNTYFLPQSTLEDNKTYYWKIVPWAGNVRGPESEIWSFTVNRDYTPRIELKLTVNPPYLEQVPGDVVSVQAIVYNLGELTDTISLSVDVPADADISAIVNEPGTMDAIPDGIAEFNITVTIAEAAKKGEVVLTVKAVSGKADEYDLVVEEKAELTVKIFGIDKPETDKSSTLFTFLNILFIIIIIIIILVLVILVNNRRKREDKKSTKETVSVKPGELTTAVISMGQAPTVAQLHGSSAANIAQELPTTTSTAPVLASSPSAAQAPASQQMPEVARLPQLPPAQSKITEPEGEETVPEPTIATTTFT